MKIAVNTRLLIRDRLDGIGRFSCETLKRITASHPEHEFIFFFDRPFDQQFVFNRNVTPVVVPPPARHPLLFLAWFEVSVPLAMLRYNPDLFLSPDGYLSLISGVPAVNVIHDLNFEHFPGDLPGHITAYYKTMFPRFAARAKRIATVSEFSKQDIMLRYGQPENKIDVVYNGASDSFKPADESAKAETRKRFSGSSPYFLYVGSLHPRKNLGNLFRAFDRFRQTDNLGMKLLVAGAKMWWSKEISTAYEAMKFRGDVIFTGRVSDPDLAHLVAGATALTYVSNFEGFGIPILEAFNSETPVITSNITSMPEVAGEAAILVDPRSVDSIAEALRRVANDPELRKDLIARGKERSSLFSWDKTAEKLWNCIEKSLQL